MTPQTVTRACDNGHSSKNLQGVLKSFLFLLKCIFKDCQSIFWDKLPRMYLIWISNCSLCFSPWMPGAPETQGVQNMLSFTLWVYPRPINFSGLQVLMNDLNINLLFQTTSATCVVSATKLHFYYYPAPSSCPFSRPLLATQTDHVLLVQGHCLWDFCPESSSITQQEGASSQMWG